MQRTKISKQLSANRIRLLYRKYKKVAVILFTCSKQKWLFSEGQLLSSQSEQIQNALIGWKKAGALKLPLLF